MIHILKRNIEKTDRLSMLLGFAMITIFVLTSGFNSVSTETINNSIANDDCENPFINALGYNAFVRYEAHLGGGDTEGPVALGGDLTLDGIITIAAHTAGTNFFGGDEKASSLVVNGKIIYDSGQGIHLNHGFVKVGDLNGSSVYDTDFNNASVNTRVTSGGYQASPRIQVQRKQPANSVGQGNLIDFEAAFVGFETKSSQLSMLDANAEVGSYNKITLIQNEVNVLNITGDDLKSLPYLTFENSPNENTPLIINVNAPGDFEWNVFNMNGIGDPHGRFILWNFFNTSKITLKGGGTLVGTLFAPKSDLTKDSSGNINGQVIVANYYHNGGELHQHVFDSCTPTTEECTLEVDAGDDVIVCEETEVTLTASVSGASQCDEECTVYGIENTDYCKANQNYVFWITDGNSPRWFSNVDLEWKEFADGTATLTGTIFDYTLTQTTYEVDATFSGRTDSTPQNSPKDHVCNDENSNDWIYYTGLSGTVTSTDGSWSVDLTRRGPAFQLGNGANQTETEAGKYGACGWFDTTDTVYTKGDFNINIGDCIAATTSEVTYLWSTGETTPSITVSEAGDYTVTVKDCESCEVSDTVTVVIDPITVDAGEDQTICLGEEATLTATVDYTAAGQEYIVSDTDYCTASTQQYALWLYSASTATNSWFTNVDLSWKENDDNTATLSGTVYNAKLDQNFEMDVTFTGKTTTPPTAASPKDHKCYETDTTGWEYYPEFSGTLTSEDGTWSTEISRTGPAFQVGNGANTNEAIDGNYGGSGWLTTTDDSFNYGDININICKEASFLWSNGATTASITVSPTETTTYTVTATTCEGCVATDEVVVNVIVPTLSAGEDQIICEGEQVVLDARMTGNEACADCVEYEVADTDYCTASTQQYVLWLYSSSTATNWWFTNVDLSWRENDNGTASLTGTVYNTRLDQNFEVDATFAGKTTTPPTASPKDHKCYETDATGWEYYPDFSGTITSQDGTWSAEISRTGPAFQVGNGANTNEAVDGRYGASGWLTTTDESFNYGDFNINIGDCISTGGNGITYLWSTGETTPSITVSPTEDTEYTVELANCGGCDISDQVTVFVSDVVADAGEDQYICIINNGDQTLARSANEQVTLTASGGDEYLWSNGATTASITVAPEVDTTYSVIVTKDGCSDTDEVTVFVKEVTASAGEDQTINLGSSAVLEATGGDEYLWSTGETTATITVSPIEDTTYTVTVITGDCQVTDEVTVTIGMIVSAGEDQTICFGEQANLTVSAGDQYQWSTGDTTQSITVSPEETTTYTVVVLSNGVAEVATVTVFVNNCFRIKKLKLYSMPVKPTAKFTVDFVAKGAQDVEINLYDLNGNKVMNSLHIDAKRGRNKKKINLSNCRTRLKRGIYILKLKGAKDHKMKTRKVKVK